MLDAGIVLGTNRSQAPSGLLSVLQGWEHYGEAEPPTPTPTESLPGLSNPLTAIPQGPIISIFLRKFTDLRLPDSQTPEGFRRWHIPTCIMGTP